MEFQQLAQTIPKPTTQWDNNDVIKFLQIMSLQAVIPKFKSMNIQGKDFKTLDRQFVTNQLQVSSLVYLKKIVGWLEYEREEYDLFLEQYLKENRCKIEKKTEKDNEGDQKDNTEGSYQNIKEEKERQLFKDKNSERDPQKSKYSSNHVKFIESDFFLASQKPQTKLVINPHLIITIDKQEYYVNDTLRIGRQPQNQVIISHDSASRFHAAITKDPFGEYHIKDLSRFGTYIKMNQRQVPINRLVQVLIGAANIILKIQRISQSTFDIRVEVPEHKINTYFQNRSNLIIGRKSKDIRIQDPTISNQHLSVYAVNDEIVLESLEGVCYQRLTHGESVKIRDEDVFRVAATLLHCRIVEKGREEDMVLNGIT